ncbi:hypothetical protein [Arthrobacter sp. NPDC057009]|uniref:hypothetical protein n=1 Tax=Arthrobacter sp. NPDC057009 TaxID=3345996 RepID=UPI003640665C
MAVEALGPILDTERETPTPIRSDAVLAELRPGLEALGYTVETGKKHAEKIRKPVLFGENGLAKVSYELDAFHDEFGIAVEVEAGRGASNNADYRDILRTSLLLDADFLVLFMPKLYRHGGQKVTEIRAYQNTRSQLDAIYASQRLRLPFRGLLLVGY